MPEDGFSELLVQAFGLLLDVALSLWQEILMWTYATVLLWVQTDMIPLMEESVRLAFMAAALVTVSVLNEIRAAWAEIKRFLLEAFVEFERSTKASDKWVKRISTILVRALENDRPIVVKREAEEEVSWDDLPPDVRVSWLKNNQETHKIDVMDAREKELKTMTLTE